MFRCAITLALEPGPVDLSGTRFLSFTTTPFDPDHLKYDELATTGWVVRIESGPGQGTMLVINASHTRPEPQRPTIRIFAIVSSRSYPSNSWITATPISGPQKK